MNNFFKKQKQGIQICKICKSKPAMSDKAKTCSWKCAGKLAWITRLSK